MQRHFSHQTRILEGTDDTLFFGIERAPRLHVVRVLSVNVQQNYVELDRGELHCVGKGAEYCIESDDRMALATVRVIDVLDIKSYSRFISSSETQPASGTAGLCSLIVETSSRETSQSLSHSV